MRQNRRILIFGRPGCGKTTLAVREMIQALKRGDHVYSNIKIVWFGELFTLAGLHHFLNFLYSLCAKSTFFWRKKNYNKYYSQKQKLEYRRDHVEFNSDQIPNENLTDLYFEIYSLEVKLERIRTINNRMEFGFIIPYYYSPVNYHYCDNLEEAIDKLITQAEENPSIFFTLAWDEGFVELEHGAKVPRFVTNFFNQTRKLSVDVIVCSQRPVAVYPGYRAICDYMVRVEKTFFGNFKARLYYVDSDANALPNLSKDAEGLDQSEYYDNWRGKDVFPFFDTRQSIGLKKLFERKLNL